MKTWTGQELMETIWARPDNLGLDDEEQEGILTIEELIRRIPQMPQVQYDSERQLRELRALANKFGLYDAADLLRDRFNI